MITGDNGTVTWVVRAELSPWAVRVRRKPSGRTSACVRSSRSSSSAACWACSKSTIGAPARARSPLSFGLLPSRGLLVCSYCSVCLSGLLCMARAVGRVGAQGYEGAQPAPGLLEGALACMSVGVRPCAGMLSRMHSPTPTCRLSRTVVRLQTVQSLDAPKKDKVQKALGLWPRHVAVLLFQVCRKNARAKASTWQYECASALQLTRDRECNKMGPDG